MNTIIRKIRPEEHDLLREFLYQAIYLPEGVEPPPRSVVDLPELQVHVTDFGTRPGDYCMAAEAEGKVEGTEYLMLWDAAQAIQQENMDMEAEKQRESKIRQWFSMWLCKQDTGLEELFAPDAVYIESWGPEYHGSGKIKLWFDEWNGRGTVERWDIRQFFHKGDQTVVEWAFRCAMADGAIQSFDGLSLIRWNEAGQICFLQEFGCNENRYDPYAQGDTPVFRAEQPLWF